MKNNIIADEEMVLEIGNGDLNVLPHPHASIPPAMRDGTERVTDEGMKKRGLKTEEEMKKGDVRKISGGKKSGGGRWSEDGIGRRGKKNDIEGWKMSGVTEGRNLTDGERMTEG